MKRSITPFGDGVVRLRLIEEGDLETTLSWRNRADVRIWFKSKHLISLEQHRSWYRNYLQKDNDFLFVIEAGGKPVGQAAVYDIDQNSGRAEIGRFLVAPEAGNRGYGSKACGLLLRFSAEKLQMRYLFLEVYEDNEKAIRVYQSNGFVEEGRHGSLIRMGLSLVLSGLPSKILTQV